MTKEQSAPKNCPQCGNPLIETTDEEQAPWYICPACGNKLPR